MSRPQAPADHRPHLLWRLAAVSVGALLIWLLVVQVSARLFPGDEAAPLNHAVNAALVFVLAVPMVVLARRRLDRRPFGGLGLEWSRRAWRPFTAGALAWLVPAGGALAVALGAGWVEVAPRLSAGELLGAVALLLVLVFVFEAFPEELIFRGYLYRNLSAELAPWVAVLVQAGIFAVFGGLLWGIAAGPEAVPGRLALFFGMAVVLGLLRLMTGSVWTCVGFHLAFQTVAQLLLSDRFAVSDEEPLTFAVFVPPLVLATLVTALLWRAPVNWGTPEPDPARG